MYFPACIKQMANFAAWGALALGSASVAFLPAEAFVAPFSAAAVDGRAALSLGRASSDRRQSALSMAAEGAKKKVYYLCVCTYW